MNIEVGGFFMRYNDKVSFTNDVFFKYILCQNDDSSYLRRLIISEVTQIQYESLEVLNPDIIPDYNYAKQIILDFLVKDEKGRKIDIEMQVSSISDSLSMRFQYYGCKMIAEEIDKGEDYTQLAPAYQIIFIKEGKKVDKLLDTFTSKNDEGIQERNNLIFRSFVYIEYIDKVLKMKSIKEFNEFEKLLYIFKYGIDNDILKVKSKMVKIMEYKYRKFTEEDRMRHYAMQRQMGQWQAYWEKKEAQEKGHQEGFSKGHQEGLEIGFQQGLQEGQYNERLSIVKQFFSKAFPEHSTTILENCSLEQLDQILIMIFNRCDYQDIEQYIKDR